MNHLLLRQLLIFLLFLLSTLSVLVAAQGTLPRKSHPKPPVVAPTLHPRTVKAKKPIEPKIKPIKANENTHVTTSSISGQVKELDGSPLSGVQVTASDTKGGTLFPSSITDKDGKYELRVKDVKIGKVTPNKAGYKFRPSNSSTTDSFVAIPLCTTDRNPTTDKPQELSLEHNSFDGEITPDDYKLTGCDQKRLSSSPYYYHEYKLKLKDKESFSLKVETPSGVFPKDFALYLTDKEGEVKQTMSGLGEKLEGIKGEFVRVAITTRKELNNGEDIPLPFKYTIKLIHKGLTVAGYEEKLKDILDIRVDQIKKYDKGFYEKLSKLLRNQKEISAAIRDLESLKTPTDDDDDVNTLRRIVDELLITLYIHSNPIKTEALDLFRKAIKSGAVVRVFGEVSKVDKYNKEVSEFKGKWLLIKASGDIEIVQENSNTLITHRSDEVISVDPNPKNIKSTLKLDIKTEYETCSYLITNAVQDGGLEFTSFVKSLFDELLPKKAQPQKQKKR